jgi:lipopolysaccharide heptosyltransferase I
MISLPASLSHPWPRRRDFRRLGNYGVGVLSECLRGPMRGWARSKCGGVVPSDPRDWRRGLIIGPSHIGDVLYNTASLPALRAGLPDCRWTYAASGAAVQVLRGNPCLDEVVAYEESHTFFDWMAHLRPVLASRQFDVVLTYSTSAWRELIFAVLHGIPNRVGYVHKGFSGIVTHPMAIRVPQPLPAYFRDLVCQLTGAPFESISSLRPHVYPTAAHEQAVEEFRARAGFDWNGPPVLACAVTSRQPSGIWPQERFLEAILQVRQQVRCTVIYFGSESDAPALRQLAERTGPGTHILAGELDLASVVMLLRRCRAALATDSGGRHLANAAGLPVVFVRNILFRREEAGAYCETDHDMAPPDLELVPPGRQAAAFARISPAVVAERVARLLSARDENAEAIA